MSIHHTVNHTAQWDTDIYGYGVGYKMYNTHSIEYKYNNTPRTGSIGPPDDDGRGGRERFVADGRPE